MAILATLRQSGGINALARQLGEPPATVMAATDALLPGLVESFKQYSGGMRALLQIIEAAGGSAMAQSIMADKTSDIQPGVMILASVRDGSSDSRDSPIETGIDPKLSERLEPLLAMLLGGYLSARAASGGLTELELTELLARHAELVLCATAL